MATIKYKIGNTGTNIIDLVGPVGCIAPTDLSGYCGGRGEPRFRPWLKGTATGDSTGFNYSTSSFSLIKAHKDSATPYSGTITEGGSNGSNYFELYTDTTQNINNSRGYIKKQESMLLSSYYIVKLSATGTVYFTLLYNNQEYSPSTVSIAASTGGTGTGLNCGSTTVILTTSTRVTAMPEIKTNNADMKVGIAQYSNVFMAPLTKAEYGEKTSLNA